LRRTSSLPLALDLSKTDVTLSLCLSLCRRRTLSLFVNPRRGRGAGARLACAVDRQTQLNRTSLRYGARPCTPSCSRHQPLITSRITWSNSDGGGRAYPLRRSTLGRCRRPIASFRFRSGVESSGTPAVDPFPRVSAADASETPVADRRRPGGRSRTLGERPMALRRRCRRAPQTRPSSRRGALAAAQQIDV